MLEPKIIPRSVTFAAVHAPIIKIERDHAKELWSGWTSIHHLENLSLEFSPATDKTPAKLTCKQADGRLKHGIAIDVHNGGLRLLMDQSFPASLTVAGKLVDEVYKKAQSVVFKQTKVHLMEARIKASMPVSTNAPAMESLQFAFMGGRANALAQLGRLSHVGFNCEIQPGSDEPKDSLDEPIRQITIEPLRENSNYFYIEVMSNWGRQRTIVEDGQVSAARGPLDLEENVPSVYIEEVLSYIEKHVAKLLEEA